MATTKTKQQKTQNQCTRELISARGTSRKHNNKDLTAESPTVTLSLRHACIQSQTKKKRLKERKKTEEKKINTEATWILKPTERERELELDYSNLKTLFSKDCSLGDTEKGREGGEREYQSHKIRQNKTYPTIIPNPHPSPNPHSLPNHTPSPAPNPVPPHPPYTDAHRGFQPP